ncbi:hypothetical protein T4B_7658 [Trichinella pseudospiralis]|uniref:Uncharacterized protein n=1 Tax=Trichinella pseudospiralis TaxID=6337 RepID=A0A0V1DWA2_TRIPS|nr:hypothetical protein T4A_6309 [Trichinella pseudospiralis]KRY68790.1 hypothetical protein T4A_8062 [Trichinella pseudospiralis]KRZ02552.1 hypothetical protein T4B_7658 [Trichinella pseudospiralis]KRZ25729.1 hypothetical protein T4C_6278 [Trichinella pseudospiralis]KRZ35387.1 hypothetical protein T4C_5303 [Trichinella pseudospiralis]
MIFYLCGIPFLIIRHHYKDDKIVIEQWNNTQLLLKSFLNTCSSLSKIPRGNKALLLVRKQQLRNASCTLCFSQWNTME